MRHIAMFSGGVGSWAAAKRIADQIGTESMTLLFADTLIEDEDLYRFLIEAAANVGAPLVRIAEGRTPWQVFFKERMLGNSRYDPCSRILKREQVDKWLCENCDPAETIVYVGIDWTEEHRFDDGKGGGLRPRRAAAGWTYEAPLCNPPYRTKDDFLKDLKSQGIKPPRLYEMGFSHNNCGGGCCKAGQGQWANLYRNLPERYLHDEKMEYAIRHYLGKDVSMMTDRSGDGKKKPLTLEALRKRIESGAQIDAFEIGGCGCFIDDEGLVESNP